MKRVDTLQAFDELVKSGIHENGARATIKMLVDSQEIDLDIIKTEFRFMNLKLYYLMAIGTVMASVGVLPKIAGWWG